MLKQTPSQTVGPFFHFGFAFQSVLISADTLGQPIYITGRVLDGTNVPVPDAMIELWQADSQGIYKSPNDPRYASADPKFSGFGRSDVLDSGEFIFKTIKPGCIPWNEEQWQAPHINVRIFARGMLIHLMTRLYFSDEPANENDPVLNSVKVLLRHQTLIAQRYNTLDLPAYRFDIVLQGENETVFFNP
jgi:protocatechuate 3,4-dioxygenase, alpha subunit